MVAKLRVDCNILIEDFMFDRPHGPYPYLF